MTAVSLVVMVVVAVLAIRWNRRRVLETRRLATIERALPEAIDLLRLGANAGLTVHLLVPAVLPSLPAPISPSFAEVQRRVECGLRLGDALDALDVLGEVAHPLLAALRSTAFDGTPLAPALERIATEARLMRRRRAEEAARRLPVQLLFPLLLCILPAFALLAVIPLLVASFGSLSW